ncbi:G-protein alpha subunit [Phlyctema vagabunda]|uniref:G-protein alpha subunit n=1 Tax=Phlyctema vagabunda TaxID=108571 RepID=A0ABR4P6E4_9HELO
MSAAHEDMETCPAEKEKEPRQGYEIHNQINSGDARVHNGDVHQGATIHNHFSNGITLSFFDRVSRSDPLSAIGLTVMETVELTGKSVNLLQDLNQWLGDDEFIVTMLMTQLTTIKSALNHIAEWITSTGEGDSQHHQLIIALGDSLKSCRNLISLMHQQVPKLVLPEGGDAEQESRISEERSRVKMILADQNTLNCQNHLTHQISALNLLLTVLNCQAQSEQKSLLESKKSRQLLDQVRDDSSSLDVLFDSASFFSRSTGTTQRSSKMSLKFLFDGELINSKVYQNYFRSLVRRATNPRRDKSNSLRRQGRKSNDSVIPPLPVVSKAVEKQLEHNSEQISYELFRDSMVRHSTIKMLVLRAPGSEGSDILHHLDTIQWESKNDLEDLESIDDLRSSEVKGAVKESSQELSGLTYTFVEAPMLSRGRWKLLHQFDDVYRIIFIVDISSYVTFEDGTLQRAFDMFERIKGQSNIWRAKSVTVLLEKFEVFESCMSLHPLETAFPDYSDSQDAISYFCDRFQKLSGGPKTNLHLHAIRSTDTHSVPGKIIRDTMDAVIEENLRLMKLTN